MSLARWYIRKREKLLLYIFRNDAFVAIVRLDEYEAARKIMLGFADTAVTSYRKNYEFKSITTYGDRDELRQQLTQAFIDPYTMILTIGAETTLLAQSISAELSSQKPVGFIDIRDPRRLGIINSYHQPDNNFFGLVDSTDHVQEHADRLLHMIPRLEHVFLVYDPLQERGYSELEKSKFVHAFAAKSVEVTSIPAASQEVVMCSVEERVKRIYKKYQHNAIITLRDPVIMSSMNILAKIAETYQTPLYSADPESALRFAAIASGYKGYDMGKEFALKVLPHVHEKTRPVFIPTIFHAMDYKTYINRIAMTRQGLQITDENREWFTHNTLQTPF